MIDNDSRGAFPIGLEDIKRTPWSRAPQSVQIMNGPNGPIAEVRNDYPGGLVAGAKVKLSVIHDKGSMVIRPNPRYTALRRKMMGTHVPLANALLLDASRPSTILDPEGSRFAGIKSWLSSHFFNEDHSLGAYDIFSTTLMRNNALSSRDVVFYKMDYEEDKYYTKSYPYEGFEYTDRDGIQFMLKRLTELGYPKTDRYAPIYAGISSAAGNLRTLARDLDELFYNPIATAVVLSEDVAEKLPSEYESQFAKAQQRLRGSGWSDPNNVNSADFVPLNVILYPKPPTLTYPQWDNYLNKLCSLVVAGGANKDTYFGGLFELLPETKGNTFAEQLQSALRGANFMATKGHIELKVRYKLEGVTPGKRYHVRFKLQADLLGRKNTEAATPYMHFTVIP